MQLQIVRPRPSARLTVLLCAGAAGLSLAACQPQAPPGAIDEGEVSYALGVLANAPQQGFASDFGARRLADLGRSAKPQDRAARDSGLHAALIAYARAEHGLSIPPGSWPADWGLRPAAYDAEADLRQALAQHRFKAWLAEQPPSAPAYRALQQAYLNYLKVAAAGGWPPLTSGAGLRPGARGPAVDALRRRLAYEDAALGEAQAGAAFDAGLAGAVGRFQAAHGLPATGAVDAETLRELNVPALTRAAQIRANLERLRWLPRQEPATRVDVNTAAGLFDYYRDGRPVLHMLAASGKPGDETPMLASAIDAVVLNPPWNVPDTIAKDELMPKEQAAPGYLEAHGFETVSDPGGGEGRLVQKPGPDSALGLVKFDFPNSYSVYLHDTPSKAAFNRSVRAVSHGCVRLEHAVAFAKILLGDETGWSASRIDQTLASGETTNVKLAHRIPVRLVYLTAFVDGGRVAFRPDVYGWDPALLQMLDRPASRTLAQVRTAPRQG
ncbi:MAG TPA: L,D-transpeptidase family protein [Phenylobacterium sp.]|jgi:murein L,D-transpeptidase YcbB/YkuD